MKTPLRLPILVFHQAALPQIVFVTLHLQHLECLFDGQHVHGKMSNSFQSASTTGPGTVHAAQRGEAAMASRLCSLTIAP